MTGENSPYWQLMSSSDYLRMTGQVNDQNPPVGMPPNPDEQASSARDTEWRANMEEEFQRQQRDLDAIPAGKEDYDDFDYHYCKELREHDGWDTEDEVSVTEEDKDEQYKGISPE